MEQEKYYAEALKGAKKGDESDARELLLGFLFAVEQKQPIPGPILEYLYSGFAAFLAEEVGLEKALLLTKPRKRPKNSRGVKVRDGRIYTAAVIAALVQLLAFRKWKQDAALLLLKSRRIAPERSAKRYIKEHSAFPERDYWTPARLRGLIRTERELAKRALTEAQRARLNKEREQRRRGIK